MAVRIFQRNLTDHLLSFASKGIRTHAFTEHALGPCLKIYRLDQLQNCVGALKQINQLLQLSNAYGPVVSKLISQQDTMAASANANANGSADLPAAAALWTLQPRLVYSVALVVYYPTTCLAQLFQHRSLDTTSAGLPN